MSETDRKQNHVPPEEYRTALTEGYQPLPLKQKNNYYNIEPGEVVIHSDLDTFIHITNDGKIYLNGDIYVNGQRLEV